MIVTVQPAGLRLDPHADETVFAAAHRAGYRWPTICGGQGTCRTCVMVVLQGREHCSPMQAWEAEGIAALKEPGDGTHRLACQTTVTGDVVVRKSGVRPRPVVPGAIGMTAAQR